MSQATLHVWVTVPPLRLQPLSQPRPLSKLLQLLPQAPQKPRLWDPLNSVKVRPWGLRLLIPRTAGNITYVWATEEIGYWQPVYMAATSIQALENVDPMSHQMPARA